MIGEINIIINEIFKKKLHLQFRVGFKNWGIRVLMV